MYCGAVFTLRDIYFLAIPKFTPPMRPGRRADLVHPGPSLPEEIMKLQTLRPQIAIVALALGVTLCSVPASARPLTLKAGARVTVPAGATLNGGSHIASAPNMGRNVNDGGI